MKACLKKTILGALPFVALVLCLSYGSVYSQKKLPEIDWDGMGRNAHVELAFQSGHTDGVQSVAFSSDGRFVASGSGDTTIKLWQVSDGKLLRTLEGHKSTVNCVAFSPDGRIIASGSHDATIKLWQASNGKLLRTLESHKDCIENIAFSLDGRIIASGSGDKTINLWQASDGKLLRTLEGHKSIVKSVAFSPDGSIIASGSYDTTIKLWQVSDGKLLRTLEGHKNAIYSVAFSPDGRTIASGLGDRTIKLWQVSDGRLLCTLEGHKDCLYSVAFSSDGSTIASGSSDKTIKLWQASDGRLLRTLEGHKFIVSSVAFSPAGRTIASGSGDKTIKLWQVSDGRFIHAPEGHTAEFTSVAFSPDGRFIASGSYDKTIKIWQVSDGRLIRILDGHSSRVLSVAISSDGRFIASASGGEHDNTIKLWQVSDGRLLRTINSHNGYLTSVVFSPDGRTIASAAFSVTIALSKESNINLWQASDGKLLRTLKWDEQEVTSVAFSPDGKIIASGSRGEVVKLWQASDGRLLHTLNVDPLSIGLLFFVGPVNSVAFSPDGRIIASGSRRTIKLWQVSDAERSITTPHAPKRSRRNIKPWQVSDRRLLRFLGGHSDDILSVAFSPDGRIIASGSNDNTIKLWRASDGKLLRILEGHSRIVSSVVFSPDGRTLVSGSFDGTQRVWNVNNGSSVAVMHLPGGEWFVRDDAGRFECSDGAWRHVGFVKGLTYYEPDQFRSKFFTPGLFKRFMDGEKLPPVDINEEVPNAPKVEIVSPSKTYIDTTGETFTVRVKAVPGKNGLSDVFLYHQGRLINEKTKGVRVQTDGVYREFVLSLLEGKNTITAGAFDRDGRAEGRSAELVAIWKPSVVVKPNMHIIAAGIRDYGDPQYNLQYADKDAKEISAILERTAAPLYSSRNVTLLQNRNATRELLRAALRKLSEGNSVHARDTLILYLSGHGYYIKGMYFYQTYGVNLERLEQEALSGEELCNLIVAQPARKVWIILDTCYSGGGVDNLNRLAGAWSKGLEEIRIIKNLAGSRGFAMLAASGPGQEAYEIKDLGRSILAHSLVETINGRKGITGSDGTISVVKLMNEVIGLTREISKKYLRQEQRPIARYPDADKDDILIGR